MGDFNGCRDLDQQRRLYDIFSRLERAALDDLPSVIKKCAALLIAGEWPDDLIVIDKDTLEELEFRAGHYDPYNDRANHVTPRSLT